MTKRMNRILSSIIFILVLVALNSIRVVVIAEESYIEKEQELRAAWVSPWGGDSGLVTYKSEEKFKQNMTYVLDTLEMYNMNTVIYHVRTHNNAMYVSELNPVSSYWEDVDFEEFDPLEWFIDECHQRGIEFHAWLNPYRVKSTAMDLNNVAERYADFPKNPASDASNLLLGTSTVIMNPGLQNVRDFIVDSVIELMEGYDVDAIHFDDYFYCDMGASGKTSGTTTILNEPDQVTYESYIDANPNCSYSKTSATDKSNWRREQVDLFIEQLDEAMDKFNKENNRYVQLGIAPTGIYKNGNGNVTYDENGNAVTNGSDTRGQTHYSSYLFCDTVKWINEGWIDYIMPQSYWSFGQSVAKYNEVMGWWNKVVKYKNVNLYSGVGLYMSDSSGNTYSWKTDDEELKKQIEFMATLENCDGASFYNFDTLRRHRDGKTTQSVTQIKNALVDACWQNKVPGAVIKGFDAVHLGQVQNLYITKQDNKNVISFDALEGAKFYCIYRSESNLTYASSEIVDIIGSKEDRIEWIDDEEGNYNYGIKALSYTNHLGEATDYSDTSLEKDYIYKTVNEVVNEFIQDFNTSMNQTKTVEDFETMASTFKTGYGLFAGVAGSTTFFSQEANLAKWSWLLKYFKATRQANNLDVSQYDNIIKNGSITADAATINMEVIAFLAGSTSYSYSTFVTSDYSLNKRNNCIEYGPYYEVYVKSYIVTFLGKDDEVLSVQRVKENESVVAPNIVIPEGYVFEKWDKSFSSIKENTIVRAVFQEGINNTYLVEFVDSDGNFYGSQYVDENMAATAPMDPVKEGYEFKGWDKNFSKITSNLKVYAIFEKIIIKEYISLIGCTIEGYSDGYVPLGSVVTIKKTTNGIFRIGNCYCYADELTMTIQTSFTIEVVDYESGKKASIIYTRTPEKLYAQAFVFGTNEIFEMGLIYTTDQTNPLYNHCNKIIGRFNNYNEVTFDYTGENCSYLYCIIYVNGVETVIYKEVE